MANNSVPRNTLEPWIKHVRNGSVLEPTCEPVWDINNPSKFEIHPCLTTGHLATQGITLEQMHQHKDSAECVRTFVQRLETKVSRHCQRHGDQCDGALHARTTSAMSTLMPMTGDNLMCQARAQEGSLLEVRQPLAAFASSICCIPPSSEHTFLCAFCQQ